MRDKTVYRWYTDCKAWKKPHDGMRAKERRRLAEHVETDDHGKINCPTCKSRGPE